MKKPLKIIWRLVIITLLTVVTQIGGIIYLLVILFLRGKGTKKRILRLSIFLIAYVFATYLIVPQIAPRFGREKIRQTENLKAHSFFYGLANRDYVKPELNTILLNVSEKFEIQNSGIKLVYLDANFPFINGFPLLPHLSHNDGKKIDVSFIYELANREVTN